MGLHPPSQATVASTSSRVTLPISRSRRRGVVGRAADDDAPPVLAKDWRSFRASLIQANRVPEDTAGVRVCEDNLQRLKVDNPALAAEGLWCHATATPEKGGLLIATPSCEKILKNDRYEQLVVFLIEHGEYGSIGLILNRPTGMSMGKGPTGMPFQLANAPPEVQAVFNDNRLYCGGFVAQHVIHLLHGHRIPGSQEVVAGIYKGGELAAAREVGAGRRQAEEFRFFAGVLAWDVGELAGQVARGAWHTAAASRALVLKQCLQLPTPLWREVLLLLGGEYAAEARAEGFSDDEDGS